MTEGFHSAIRHARMSDAETIATLIAELGYPTDADCAGIRLQRLLSSEAGGVLVYEHRGVVVGVAAYQMIDLLERPRPQCRITALVVRPSSRRGGVARALVEAIEARAVKRGCFRLEVTTRADRRDASAFYEALGFEERPRRLVKRLGTHI